MYFETINLVEKSSLCLVVLRLKESCQILLSTKSTKKKKIPHNPRGYKNTRRPWTIYSMTSCLLASLCCLLPRWWWWPPLPSGGFISLPDFSWAVCARTPSHVLHELNAFKLICVVKCACLCLLLVVCGIIVSLIKCKILKSEIKHYQNEQNY